MQALWVAVGTLTHWDPFPFVFLLTVSNMIQLVLIFIIAVAQKDEGESHDERHESLHQRFDHILEALKAHGHASVTESTTDMSGR